MTTSSGRRAFPRGGGKTGPRVFICYRRDDTLDLVNGLSASLENRIPRASVFTDIDSIPWGADVQERIRGEMEICDAVLVVIGSRWLDARDENGRRLDDPDDFVRTEIAAALAGRPRVLPVLTQSAKMPSARDLPEDIRELAGINAFRLDGQRWRSDIEALARLIREPPRRRRDPSPLARRPFRGAALAASVTASIAALFVAGFALSSAFSPETSDAARPTTSLEVVSAPTVGLSVPAFTGAPAALEKKQPTVSTTGSSGGATTPTPSSGTAGAGTPDTGGTTGGGSGASQVHGSA